MKVVILAGGLGTRLAEETEVRPKPMVEVGRQPILWHIMKHYARHGFKDFFVALGYKAEFSETLVSGLYPPYRQPQHPHEGGQSGPARTKVADDWTVHLMDTGTETATGGRVRRLQQWLQNDTFMVTYGDGVANIDLQALLEFHQHHGRLATVTASMAAAPRYGGLLFDGDLVAQFTEKPQAGEGWINGGFLVFQPEIFKYIEGDGTNSGSPHFGTVGPGTGSWPLSVTKAFGSAWTRSVTSVTSTAFGNQGGPRGNSGHEELLAGSPGLCDWCNGFGWWLAG